MFKLTANKDKEENRSDRGKIGNKKEIFNW